MAEAILDALAPVLTRWTMGGSAHAVAPADWRGALGADSDAELRLLALSGQFLGVLALAEPTGEIKARADLPVLLHPPLPDSLRPRARRLLEQLREPVRQAWLLDFLAARGWTLHPGDWMPGATAEVPEVYAPWQDWVASGAPASEPTELTGESWDTLGAAARTASFAALRRRDPAQARALLGQKLAGENADIRVRLLEALTAGLSDADRPLLESLDGDRAPRVKALAASLLARLGVGCADEADAAELAGFFPVQVKGLVRRVRVIAPQELKTPAQRSRRQALMETVPLAAFARAAGMATDELIAAWPIAREPGADVALAGMAARSAPDAIVAALMEALIAAPQINPYGFDPLLPRLAIAQRRAAAIAVLRAKGGTFEQALRITGGNGRLEEPMQTAAATAMLSALKAQNARPADHAGELAALGLVASRAAATEALDQLATAGLIASDPRLDMLRLNAALEDRGRDQ